MYKLTATRLKVLLVFVLFTATAIAFIQLGMGGLTFIMAVASIMSLLWFMRKPRPDKELPNSSVSCCHYLRNEEYEKESR